MSNTLTLNNPLTESDWDKICDVELEKTEHIWFKTPSGKRVDFVRGDVLNNIRAEIVELQKDYHEYGWAYDDALEIIDKYKEESERVTK